IASSAPFPPSRARLRSTRTSAARRSTLRHRKGDVGRGGGGRLQPRWQRTVRSIPRSSLPDADSTPAASTILRTRQVFAIHERPWPQMGWGRDSELRTIPSNPRSAAEGDGAARQGLRHPAVPQRRPDQRCPALGILERVVDDWIASRAKAPPPDLIVYSPRHRARPDPVP